MCERSKMKLVAQKIVQGEAKKAELFRFFKSPIRSIFMRESVQLISHMKIPFIGDF